MNFLHFTLPFELVRKKKLMQEAVSAMTADDTNFCICVTRLKSASTSLAVVCHLIATHFYYLN